MGGGFYCEEAIINAVYFSLSSATVIFCFLDEIPVPIVFDGFLC